MPDPARVAEFRAEAGGPARQEGRHLLALHDAGRQARQVFQRPSTCGARSCRRPGVSFVNLQYGDCAEEIARAEEKFGVTIHQIEGLDLRDDIDGTAALCAALDLVLSAPTAAAATAASVGAPVWFLTAGRTWPQLGTDEYPWYAKTRVLSPEKFGDWASADAGSGG